MGLLQTNVVCIDLDSFCVTSIDRPVNVIVTSTVVIICYDIIMNSKPLPIILEINNYSNSQCVIMRVKNFFLKTHTMSRLSPDNR